MKTRFYVCTSESNPMDSSCGHQHKTAAAAFNCGNGQLRVYELTTKQDGKDRKVIVKELWPTQS